MKILVVGYRKELCQLLERSGLPYALWTEVEPKTRRSPLVMVGSSLSDKLSELHKAIQLLKPYGPFTHVIAGTESGVYPAAVARRELKARLSDESVIIRCHDKMMMKSHLKSQGIPMTDFLGAESVGSVEDLVDKLGLPLVVKERRLSGGRGLHVLHSNEAIKEVLHPRHIIERFVKAEEASVESFVNRGQILFSNLTRYVQKSHVNLVPGQLESRVEKDLLGLNERVIRAMNIQWGLVHLEAYLTSEGPLFGELALRPPGGHIMSLLELAYGFDPWKAYLAVETDEPFTFPKAAQATTAAVVLHPGEGVVRGIEGLEALRHHPKVVRYSIKIKAGEMVGRRLGLGQDVGYFLVRGSSKAEVLQSIAEIEEKFRILLGRVLI